MRKSLRLVVSVICVAALLLALGLRASQIRLSDSRHLVTKAPATTTNAFNSGDTPDAIMPAARVTLALPVALVRLGSVPGTAYQARLRESPQHDRAPPLI